MIDKNSKHFVILGDRKNGNIVTTPEFFSQASKWCLIHIGVHGVDWELYTKPIAGDVISTVINLKHEQDVTLFKLAYPYAVVLNS
jgi:hypothetical protein